MENYITKDYDFYGDENREEKLKEYKIRIDHAIKEIISNKSRLVFARVVKIGDISNIAVFKYPELRGYILTTIKHEKEIQVINQRIDRAVSRMDRLKKRITFIGLMSSCKFSSDDIYNNIYIKERIREIVIENSKKFYTK